MNVPTWHYKIEQLVVTEPVDAHQLHRLTQALDNLGREGWEAVTFRKSRATMGEGAETGAK